MKRQGFVLEYLRRAQRDDAGGWARSQGHDGSGLGNGGGSNKGRGSRSRAFVQVEHEGLRHPIALVPVAETVVATITIAVTICTASLSTCQQTNYQKLRRKKKNGGVS